MRDIHTVGMRGRYHLDAHRRLVRVPQRETGSGSDWRVRHPGVTLTATVKSVRAGQ